MKNYLLLTTALFLFVVGASIAVVSCGPQSANSTPGSAAADDTASIQSPIGVSIALASPLTRHFITLPRGFKIEYFARNIANAREMTLGAAGTVFVGSWTAGNVYALIDSQHTGHADQIYTIAHGLNNPVGVAFRDGSLYVAESTRILRYDNIESRLTNPPAPVVVYDGLPNEGDHGVHFIAFGPDGKLYVPIGAPCNICLVNDPEGAITRMNPDGSGFEVFARGIRNSVGLDWNPATGNLWFTDNGRDLLGDNEPPDKLNCAPAPDMNFGFPYCDGGDIVDPDFGKGHTCSEFTAPAMPLGPHVASLGMRFYTGKMFPPEYRNQIFIAEHGSWNSSVPVGDRVTLVRVGSGCTATSYQPFADGWQLADGTRWGRPADVMVMPDGALLVSDDLSGAVFRISYEEPYTGRSVTKD